MTIVFYKTCLLHMKYYRELPFVHLFQELRSHGIILCVELAEFRNIFSLKRTKCGTTALKLKKISITCRFARFI